MRLFYFIYYLPLLQCCNPVFILAMAGGLSFLSLLFFCSILLWLTITFNLLDCIVVAYSARCPVRASGCEHIWTLCMWTGVRSSTVTMCCCCCCWRCVWFSSSCSCCSCTMCREVLWWRQILSWCHSWFAGYNSFCWHCFQWVLQ